MARRPAKIALSLSLLCLLCLSVRMAIASGDDRAGNAEPRTDSPGGPSITFALPLPDSELATVCSQRHGVCLRVSPHVAPLTALATLASLDRAWEALIGVLAFPPPQTQLDGSWDAYLIDPSIGDRDPNLGGPALLTERDPRTHFDSATSFGIIDARTPVGCQLDWAVARAVARASLWRAVPATDEGSARAQAEELARLAVPCAAAEANVEEFQSHPERTLLDPSSVAFDRGASFFFEWLNATFSREPGGLIRGLWALAPTRTPPGATRWSTAPTGFDVLRVSLKGAFASDSTLDDIFVQFAVRRAQWNPPARIAWHIPWPQSARRLASPEPVSPTGASYVLVDHAGARAGSKLRMEAQWEDYGRLRWVVMKIDSAGQTTAVLPVTSLVRGTRASMTVESLDAVDRILIVGINVGSTEHPFDPDQAEWEPHGWLLTLAAE
jgi:hypothetical protein